MSRLVGYLWHWKPLQMLAVFVGKALWQPLPPRADPAARRWHPQAEMVSLVVAVCLAIFLTKLVLACQALSHGTVAHQLWDEDWAASLSRLAGCCAEDFAVGLGCLLLATMAFAIGATRVYRWGLRAVIYACTLISLVLLAVDALLFGTMRSFMTATDLQMAVGFDLQANLGDALTAGARLTLVLVPLVPLAVHLGWVRAVPRFWQWLARGLCRPAVLVLLIGAFAGLAQAVQNEAFFPTHPDFAQNPHLLLARSYLEPGDTDFEAGPASDSTDFLPGRPRPSEGLVRRRPQNIVLIVLESVAAPYLDLHGGPYPLTPQLQRLQHKGIVFDNFYATSNHSIGSGLPLFGSTYNDPQYVSTVMKYPNFPVPGVSAWLKKRGYKTYLLAGGGTGIWEDFHSMASIFVNDKFDVDRDVSRPFWSRTANPERIYEWEYQDKDMFADAHRVLAEAKDQPFFLMMWNYGTHWPYTPEGPCPVTLDERHFPPCLGDTEWRRHYARFLRSIYCVDAFLGQFYEELERLGLADNTLVAVTADHGETFGQHLGIIHGHTVYEEEVHVPLVLLNPHIAHLGPRNKVVGSHIDLWPTIMDICGLPCDPRWQGRSLLGGRPDEVRRAYFASRANRQLGLRQGNYKYIWDGQKRRHLLYDLQADPEEQTNLAGSHADLCAEFYGRIVDWRRFMAPYTVERMLTAPP
jgi:arylsulfatase A-like enzyme